MVDLHPRAQARWAWSPGSEFGVRSPLDALVYNARMALSLACVASPIAPSVGLAQRNPTLLVPDVGYALRPDPAHGATRRDAQVAMCQAWRRVVALPGWPQWPVFPNR
ncbi:hypothetical protein ACCAA_550029 [Candidatus Accumulibacter aalborgensis]|uniref:Uncharacterized protein n=1 Tax=Candidatus Accumulibacter aalborgensis TaxID=1860102 RepID=A0A1A8XSY6_9PROT|nr:hypothetical protein ACCAA_550029 [Candidatus Accumulibacter aalborgensis]